MRTLIALALSILLCGPSIAGSLVTADAIRSRIADAIAARIPTPGHYRVTLANPDFRLELPAQANGQWQLAALTWNPSRQNFEATISHTNELGSSDYIPLSGTALAVIEVPTLVHDLPAGQLISASDIAMMEYPADRNSMSLVTSADALVGQAPRRNLRANTPLFVTDVTKPVLVRKGDVVVVTFLVPGIQVTTQGIAQNNAAQGETVSVLNSQSRRAIEARVTGMGTATVSTPSALVASAQ